MYHFIETEVIERSGAAGERRVWEALKGALRGRDGIAYWRYPMFTKVGEVRKEADILLLDHELGLIVIEVKSIRMEQIKAIEGHRWYTPGFYTSTINPYQQAEDAAYAFIAMLARERSLRGAVPTRALVALPLISAAEWEGSEVTQGISAPHHELILSDQLSPAALLRRLEGAPLLVSAPSLDTERWEVLLATMNAAQVHRKGTEVEPIHLMPKPAAPAEVAPSMSKGEVIKHIRAVTHAVDLQQAQLGLSIPDGVQRIRGIAGSGKTVILCQKIANMHLKHPDWLLGFVFFTRSLYDTITRSIDQWLRHYSQGAVTYESAQSRIHIMHAWGSRDQQGLYSEACALVNRPKWTPGDCQHRQPNEGLAEAVCALLNHLKAEGETLPQVFDALLIDEGQDLVVDPPALRFEGKQSMYWMAYQLLKPVEGGEPDQRRLIWAYDEAQRLDALAIPSAKEIFGAERAHLFVGAHKGNIKRSEVMRRCYRTPGRILTAAHAIGMGFLREQGMLSGITTKEEWSKIGYEVTGDFRKRDSEVIIHRPPENSPNIMPNLWGNDLIEYQRFRSNADQLDHLAKALWSDVMEHGVEASRQILVVVIASPFDAERAEKEVAEGLMQRQVPVYIPTALSSNILNPRHPKNDKNKFWHEGAVTVSRVTRAKGNEAEMVYVVGLERVAENEGDHAMRNQLFVALTRARCWVHLSAVVSPRDGVSEALFYDELARVLASGDTFRVLNKPSVREIDHEEQESLFPELDLLTEPPTRAEGEA
jgi:superfamily I DNA and RNA helicase